MYQTLDIILQIYSNVFKWNSFKPKILQIRLDEGPENITDDQMKISGLEYGCQMIVKYGVRLKLLSPTTEPQSLENLCKCTARALLAQQHNAREFFY